MLMETAGQVLEVDSLLSFWFPGIELRFPDLDARHSSTSLANHADSYFTVLNV